MATPSNPGLAVRYGTDLGDLADDLASRLAESPLGALEAELVVVPTPGIRTWLEGRLATRLGSSGSDDGVAANVEMLFFDGLLRRVTGRAATDPDPWTVGAMTFAAIDLLAAAPEGSALDAIGPGRRTFGLFETARGCADLFDQLFKWRPDVADDWLEGDTSDPRAALLRSLRDRTVEPPPHRSLAVSIDRLSLGGHPDLDLPSRIHLFGGDSLPGGPQIPAVLDALGTVRDVTMHVIVPAAFRFDSTRLATGRFAGVAPDRTAGEDAVHPLLRTWGTLSRETAMLLAQLGERATTSFTFVEGTSRSGAGELGSLQRAIRTPDPEPEPKLHDDHTIELHQCIGDLRQVEVLRDAILHALNDMPGLAPQDVVVLCPDLPRFAPLVEAVLGAPQGAPPLPFFLSDRSLTRAVPLIASMGRVLALLAGRFSRSSVLDLLQDPFIRSKFDLAEEDVDTVVEWAAAGEVRWGLDGEHRASAGLPASFESGTWRRALDRLLLGTALRRGTPSTELGLRALDPGQGIERLGRFSDLVAALAQLDDAARADRAITEWCAFVRELADILMATSYDDAWQLEHLRSVLAGLDVDAAGTSTSVDFAEFRAAFNDRATQAQRPVTSGSNGVMVTSLAPLRNVPFGVVAVLGLDERALQQSAGIDIAFGAARIGDRDPRAEVRAALLGALLGARERLIVTYEGADLVTNLPVPEAAALAELRDAIGTVSEGGWQAITFVHPRHGHGRLDLLPDPAFGGRPFSFDRDALARARELQPEAAGARRTSSTLRAGPSADAPARVVDIAKLATFLEAPQRTFLADSLGVYLPQEPEPPSDDLPTSLDALELWKATSSLLAEGMRELPTGFDDSSWSALTQAWLEAPDSLVSVLPGRLSRDAIEAPGGAGVRALALLRAQQEATGGTEGAQVACSVTLDDGTTVVGSPTVYGDDTVITVTASTNKDKARIAGSLDLLLLTACYPDTTWRGIRIWREKDVVGSARSFIGGSTQQRREARAREALGRLVDLLHRGLDEPVPLFFLTTMRMFEKLKETTPPDDLLIIGHAGWDVYLAPGDRDDLAVRFCFDASYEDLCDLERQPGDPSPSHECGGSRLLAYSLTACEALAVVQDVPRGKGRT
jgi:exodeoxyribonuclease V gamma subunit